MQTPRALKLSCVHSQAAAPEQAYKKYKIERHNKQAHVRITRGQPLNGMRILSEEIRTSRVLTMFVQLDWHDDAMVDGSTPARACKS